MPESKPCRLIPVEGRVILRVLEQPLASPRQLRPTLHRYEVLACGERREPSGNLRVETEVEVGDVVYARPPYDDVIEDEGDVYVILPYEAIVARVPGNAQF